MNERPRVFLGVGGGIAAYKAADLVRRLGDRGFEVRCGLTQSAKSFLGPLTLEVLSGHAVYEEEYLTATGRGEESHIVVAKWADVLLFAPATAHLLARLALGLADDFLTTTALAFPGPLVLAPAMHAEMWNHEAVRRNAETLRRRGAIFAGPEEGPLASGEWGMGRFADPAKIAEIVAQALERNPPEPSALEGRTVVVSAGPTHEPLDPVRFLGNRSSGKMGFAIAAEAARQGARTILVAGPVHLETPPGVERINVETALEMERAVHEAARPADLVVMTAAVADFRPASTADQKIKKEGGVPTVDLEQNPDILTGLAEVAPKALRVGFAAETEDDAESAAKEARAKLERKKADFLVWNHVATEGIGFGADDNEVTVYRCDGEPIPLARRSKTELAGNLVDLFEEALESRARETS